MHGEFLRIEGHDDHLTDAVKDGVIPDDLDERRRAMLHLGEKLTREPETMKSEDYQPLRELGFDDEDLYDLIFVISFTNHMDRVADALNAVVGDEEQRCREIADVAKKTGAGG